MHIDMRESLAETIEQFEVPVEREFGVHPALHEDLGAPDVGALLDLVVERLV